MFFFIKIIIPLAFVGYEMIIANSYPTRARGIIVKYRVYAAHLITESEKTFRLAAELTIRENGLTAPFS